MFRAEFSEDVFKRCSCEWERPHCGTAVEHDADDLADLRNCTSLVCGKAFSSCVSHKVRCCMSGCCTVKTCREVTVDCLEAA